MDEEQRFWEVVEEGLESESGFYAYHEGGEVFQSKSWLHFEAFDGQ